MSPTTATAPIDRREVDAALIGGLYRRVKPLLFANFGALVLLTAALWGSADRLWLLVWAAVLGGWTLVRFGLARLYLRRPRPIAEVWRWTLAFAVGSGIAGCLWGASSLLVASLPGDAAGLVSAFVMAALSAAAIAGYTNSLLAFGAFLAPALAPYAARLILLDGGFDPMVAAFCAFWAVLMAIMARHLNDGFREGLGLSLRNARLAEGYRVERDRAAAASRAKSRFLGHMSHELRTPLTAVLGYAEMMKAELFGPLGDDRYAGYAEDIRASGSHLLQTIDRIIDMASLEEGALALDLAAADAGAVMREAAEAAEPRAAAEGIALTVEVAPDLPALTADRGRLRQMADLLLDNALAFTPAGGRVTVIVRADGGDGLAVTVADTGVGIPAGAVARLLTPFGRIEDLDHLRRTETPKPAGPHTGMGLGLPLVRLLAEAHGGAVQVESTVGAGTAVTLRFPAGGVPAAAPPVGAAELPAAAL